MEHTIQVIPDTVSSSEQEMNRIFNAQQQNQFQVARTSVKERIAKLRKLERALLSHRAEIRQALYKDFHKHPGETDMWEMYVILNELRHTIRHLRRWMQPQRVATLLTFLGSKSHIHYEPKGVVLIIAPWNFPINLTFGPLVSAIAAGNCVMLKPSELTPHSSALMAKIIRETFPEHEIALFEGGVEVSEALLKLPFNHIFYTGSTAVGKIVMRAAAEHLASVTLELGGKSPTIVDETANLDLTARRIAWGKTANSGQTCVAPDYLIVHEKVKDKLLNLIVLYWEKFYGKDVKTSPFYTHIVNQRHFNRLKNYVEEAQGKGAEIRIGGAMDAAQNYIEPMILENVPPDAKVLQEEIFGPILPVVTFKNIQEVVELVNSKERPLALYIFSKSKQNIKFIMQETRAGTVSINQNIVHFLQTNLPFGGVNHSGIGKSHGWWGFEAFSNAKAILRQDFFGASELFMPPFTKLKEKINDLALKWF